MTRWREKWPLVVTISTSILFLYLWISAIAQGIGWNYMEEGIRDLQTDVEGLRKYLVVRNSDISDRDNFENLGYFIPDTEDCEFDPFELTKLGFVEFASDGSILRICSASKGVETLNCPNYK